MTDKGIRVLVAMLAVVATVSSMACGTGSKRRLPAAVTLRGVGGIKIGMSAEQVDRLLHAPGLAFASGSSQWTYTLICAGKMEGVAGFFGPFYENPLSGDVNGLEWIWFRAGANTDHGVGVGSTRADVVRAYGTQLHRDSVPTATDPPNLYIVGPPLQIHPAKFIRPVLYFSFGSKGKVVAQLGYGARQQIVGGKPFEGAFC
jgi:hypothetical protein